MIHQRHRQTDGQTDDMRFQDCALHYSASRSKNAITLQQLRSPGGSMQHLHGPWKQKIPGSRNFANSNDYLTSPPMR